MKGVRFITLFLQILGSIETVTGSLKSFGILLNPAQKLRTWMIYIWATGIAIADIIGLSSMVPVLMLAIDHSFLEKSRKLQAIYHHFGFESESSFLKVLIVFILIFFLVKSIAALWLNKFVRKTAIEICKDLSASSYDYAFRNNSYEKVASDGLGFNDMVLFTPYYYISGIYLPFINLISESVVVFMLVAVFTIYKPMLFFLIVGLLGTAFYIVNRYTRNRITNLGEESGKDRDAALNDLNFGISGFADVKAHGVEEFFKLRFMGHYSGFVAKGIKAVNYQLIPARVNEFVALLGIVMLVIYGYYYSGDNLGQVRVLAALFAISVFRLIPAANRLLQSLMHLKLNNYTIHKLIPVRSANKKSRKSEQTFTEKIELKDMGFKYENTTTPVFQDLNLTIHRGEILGIYGSSGSGKTTLAKILMGFYEPGQGKLRIDGNEYTKGSDRLSVFSYMGQEPFIFTGTVLDNVALGIEKGKVDVEKAKLSLEKASFNISGVTEPLDHFLGENGAKLSEGQKQRLVLARELYRNAPVIILDEPTSALDSETEKDVLKTLKELNNTGKTLIIISHRDRVFDICSTVYALENFKLNKTK